MTTQSGSLHFSSKNTSEVAPGPSRLTAVRPFQMVTASLEMAVIASAVLHRRHDAVDAGSDSCRGNRSIGATNSRDEDADSRLKERPIPGDIFYDRGSRGNKHLDLAPFVFERQQRPFNVCDRGFFHLGDVGVGHSGSRCEIPWPVPFTRSAPGWGKDMDLERFEVAVALFFGGGPHVAAGVDIRKFSRCNAAYSDFLGQAKQYVARSRLDLETLSFDGGYLSSNRDRLSFRRFGLGELQGPVRVSRLREKSPSEKNESGGRNAGKERPLSFHEFSSVSKFGKGISSLYNGAQRDTRPRFLGVASHSLRKRLPAWRLFLLARLETELPRVSRELSFWGVMWASRPRYLRMPEVVSDSEVHRGNWMIQKDGKNLTKDI